jgi:hypothetical protein
MSGRLDASRETPVDPVLVFGPNSSKYVENRELAEKDGGGGASVWQRILLVSISIAIGLTNIHWVAMRYYLVDRLEASPSVQGMARISHDLKPP